MSKHIIKHTNSVGDLVIMSFGWNPSENQFYMMLHKEFPSESGEHLYIDGSEYELFIDYQVEHPPKPRVLKTNVCKVMMRAGLRLTSELSRKIDTIVDDVIGDARLVVNVIH